MRTLEFFDKHQLTSDAGKRLISFNKFVQKTKHLVHLAKGFKDLSNLGRYVVQVIHSFCPSGISRSSPCRT